MYVRPEVLSTSMYLAGLPGVQHVGFGTVFSALPAPCYLYNFGSKEVRVRQESKFESRG